MMNEKRIAEILDCWFGPLADDGAFPEHKAKLWFEGGEEFDEILRKQYEKDHQLAVEGKLDGWKTAPRGRLALILLLDQFSRNMYRNTPGAFAYDAKALELAREGIQLEQDCELHPLERWFFYMPFMHAESEELQKMSILLYTRLLEETPPALELPLAGALDFAKRHAKIIARFGRFPYRNEVLGRESTAEELDYLTKAGESWF